MLGGEVERKLEHHMSRRHPDEGADQLRADVGEHVMPPEAALPGIGKRDGGVEMTARDGPEGQDEGDQHRPCR